MGKRAHNPSQKALMAKENLQLPVNTRRGHKGALAKVKGVDSDTTNETVTCQSDEEFQP